MGVFYLKCECMERFFFFYTFAWVFLLFLLKKSAPKLSYVLSHLKILVYSNLPELMFANSLCIIFSLSLIKLH